MSFNYGNITCRNCPYGGDCENSITAVANFWGYSHGDAVSFQHCPPDYCCSTTNCLTINACADNRQGRLCGQCESGYSEATFSPNCVPDETCHGNLWIYPFTVAVGLLYGFFLVFQKDIRDFIFVGGEGWKKYFLCCLVEPARRVSKTIRRKSGQIRWKRDHEHGQSNGQASQGEYELANRPITYTDATHDEKDDGGDSPPEIKEEPGFIIILFYYFQDALLLHIDTIYTKTVSKLQKQLKDILIGLFRFRFDIFTFFGDVCMFPGLTPVTKTFFKTLFVPYVLLLFGAFYFMHRWCNVISSQQHKRPTYERHLKWKLSSRLSSGFVLAMLFTYQKLATTTFTLLNCVPVGNHSVLFIDGTQVRSWYDVMSLYVGIAFMLLYICMLSCHYI